ncbi:MFS transporter [Rhodococcus qingshengii]|uniref:MFS transporter n=1 Tax=Rhodococcus qingshengii TaxID=334542 RepID=UPI0035D6BFC0
MVKDSELSITAVPDGRSAAIGANSGMDSNVRRVMAGLALGQFGNNGALVSMVLIGFPITVAELDPDNKAISLALLMGVHSLIALVAIPFFGALSDRCTSRLGMRTPFILVGTATEFIAMVGMGLSGSVSMLILFASIHAIGGGVYQGGFSALVPDQIGPNYRARAMGLLTMMNAVAGLVASVFIPAIIGNQLLLFVLPGFVMLVTTLNAVYVIRDRKLSISDRPNVSVLRALLEGYRVNPKRIPDYSWGWSAKAVFALASALLTTYAVYMLTDHLGVTAEDLPALLSIKGVIGLVAAVGGAWFGTWLSDKLQIRKRLAVYAAVLTFAGAMIIALSPSVPVYLIGLAILGFGTGAYLPIEGAVVVDVLPGEGKESGKYMSLMAVADRAPRSLGSFFAPALLAFGALTALGSYPMVYVAGGILAIIAGLLVRQVKGSV